MTASPHPIWQIARRRLVFERPMVMGIVNVTPDSFATDTGAADVAALARAAIAHAESLCQEGADLLDIGGESTRPGAQPVPADEELARVLPVVRAALTWGLPVSVDTSEPRVMQAVLEAGADIVNDVRALRRPGALEALAAHPEAGVVAMHMRGEPATMQQLTEYDDVVAAVCGFFGERLARFVAAGIVPERVALDPGIGFAKTPVQNLELLQRQRELLALGRPLLVGWSRKSTLGIVTGRPVHERLPASIAAALAAAAHGASVLRVHDVAATVDALKVWRAAQSAVGVAVDNS